MNNKIELYEDGIGKVELVDFMGSDLTVVNAARVSLGVEKKKLDKKDKILIQYLLDNEHTSPFEHCVITFRFKVPLFVRSQHQRHRTWSYNEISRRYTSFNIEFYEPKQFRKQHENNRQSSTNELFNPAINTNEHSLDYMTAANLIKFHHRECLNIYNKLLENGVCREQARGVLPQNVYTEYYGTVNLNNLCKFIKLRFHEGAQWEIQQVAKALIKICLNIYPETSKYMFKSDI